MNITLEGDFTRTKIVNGIGYWDAYYKYIDRYRYITGIFIMLILHCTNFVR